MSSTSQIIATTYFEHPHIKGIIEFYEVSSNNQVNIIGQLKSTKYKESYHGFHVHEAGDLSEKCMGACAHFNPYDKKHGGPNSHERHVGDLGNIYFDKKGNAQINTRDNQIKLRGTKSNIIGRSLVIHEKPDDLGMGGHEDSLTTGHAGARITCAVIGYSKKMFKK
jgi:superoxide dismutase, Cu-Zn family